jgi:glycosyltransferase involved in cell wall biosynthesis
MPNPVYSFVIPIYNEKAVLPELHRRLCELFDRLDGDVEVVLVDDGSRDGSYEAMRDLAARDPRFRYVQLSRNFGHQVAITAGMDYSLGQAVIIMDADLQDPPEVVLEMIQRWREGYEIVYGVREEREGETWFKKVTAAAFYRLLRRTTDLDIPVDVGDFRLVDRKAIEAFKGLREKGRYVRGLFSWIGFRQTGVRYKRAARFAGETKYPMKKMLKLAADGIISFSQSPLRIATNLGLAFVVVSAIGAIATGVTWAAGRGPVPLWVPVLLGMGFFSGAQLVAVGVLGEYLGRVFDEVKGRPLYIVRDTSAVRDTAWMRE